jgi:hypothetical protein
MAGRECPQKQQQSRDTERGLATFFPRRTFFKDPELNVDFQFVGVADFAPFSFRRAAFMDIGGMDEGASEPGMCGIISDWEVGAAGNGTAG